MRIQDKSLKRYETLYLFFKCYIFNFLQKKINFLKLKLSFLDLKPYFFINFTVLYDGTFK